MKALVVIVALMCAPPARAQNVSPSADSIVVRSPDGTLVATFAAADPASFGPWRYRLDRESGAGRVELLGWSPLGLVLDGTPLADLAWVGEVPSTASRERYELPAGKRRVRDVSANSRAVVLSSSKGLRLELHIRVADDSFAFRYVLPDPKAPLRRLTGELTGFRVPPASRAWLLPQDPPGRFTPAYENLFSSVTAGAAAPTPQGWAYPALVKTPGGPYLLITEADVTPENAGTRLASEVTDGIYRVRLPDPGEGLGQGSVEPARAGRWVLPWRVVITGELPAVFAATTVEDLSTPAAGDFSWVKPGRASFGWWIDEAASKKEDVLKAFVDLAAEMGWEYSLIDANWHLAREGAIDRVIAYAREKKVGVFLWYNSGGAHNDVTEWGPRDRIFEAAARKAEFARVKALGVAGIKVDFWHSDKPPVIALYHDVLRDAAEAGLLVALHGSTTPRGWSRTYPNLLSMEAVFNAEQYKYNERYAREAASHNAILPFTRNVIGSMDYLPAALSDQIYEHQTTNAHELALTVVFESGIVHFPDSAKAYQELPPAGQSLIKAVPVAWDESILLDGEPGRLAVVARRRGREWWVGAINGLGEAQSAAIDLSFLAKGEWQLTMVRDGGAPRHLLSEAATVRPVDRFNVPMLARGGFLMRFVAVE